MPAAGPEIAVRLSASGVQDVVNAFARVRQEGKKTGSETASALSQIGTSLTGLASAVGVGLVIGKLGQLVLAARESAENIGKLSEKTGAGVGTLSALALSAHDSEVGMDQLSAGMVKLAKAQAQATAGGKEQQKAFAAVGVSVKDLNATNPGDLFVRVAQKMAALPAGANRTAIALKLFGKAGAELIPMLNALGADGFDQAVEKAKRLGLYLSDDMVNSARAAQDQFHLLEGIAAGLATQFNAGFMPGVTAGVETLATEIQGRGVDSMKGFGEAAGTAFARIATGIAGAGDFIKTFSQIVALQVKYYSGLVADFIQSIPGVKQAEELGAKIGGGIKHMAEGALGYVRGKTANNSSFSLPGYAAHSAEIDALIRKIGEDDAHLKGALAKNLAESRKRNPTSYPIGTGAPGDGTTDEERKKAQEEANKRAAAHSALLQARADNEIAILKAANQIEEADDKRKYDAGLLTLSEYYDRRAKRIDESYEAEYLQLKDKEKAAQALPSTTAEQKDKRLQEIEKIQTAELELTMKHDGDLAALSDERAKATKDAADKQLQAEQRLATMQGDRAGAARLALQAELQDYTELLQKQGKSADEIARATAEYRRRAQAKIDFGENQAAGSAALNDLGLNVQSVTNAQGSGAISQVAATAQVLKLQQAQLPLLQDIGDQMLANALAAEDPQITEQALAYNMQLDTMRAKLQNVKTAATEFTDIMSQQGPAAFTDFFADVVDGSKNAGDAFDDLASTFEKAIGRMIAQLATYYLLSAIVGFVAPNSSFATALKSKGPFGGSSGGYSSDGFAEGGWTGGTRGKPAGVVHGEEFVVKAGPAAANRPTLEAMNAGMVMPTVATAADYATPMPSSAEGTVVNVPPTQVNIHNYGSQQVQQKQSQSQDGSNIIDIIIGEAAKDVAKGGKLSKAMASTYGLSRKGTVR